MGVVTYTKKAIKGLRKLPPHHADNLVSYFGRIAAGGSQGLDIKALHGRGGFRLRSGDYRAIYEIEGEQINVLVLDTGRCGSIYKWAHNLSKSKAGRWWCNQRIPDGERRESMENCSSWVFRPPKPQFQGKCHVVKNGLGRLGEPSLTITSRTWSRWTSSPFQRPRFVCSTCS